MTILTSHHTMVYANLRTDDKELYNEVVDFLSDVSGIRWSFFFEMDIDTFKDITAPRYIARLSKEAQHAIGVAANHAGSSGADFIEFELVREGLLG